MNKGVLRRLAFEVDGYDETTPPRHQERVAGIAGILAAEAGWASERSLRLMDAALVHDVGKVIVPRAVLSAARELSHDDWEAIRAHPVVGRDLLILAGYDAEQQRWVCQHHERPDGRGYPEGVPLRRIDEGAQILAVADTWDVMRQGRRYQHAKTIVASLAEAERIAGHQLSRWAVDLLARSVGRSL